MTLVIVSLVWHFVNYCQNFNRKTSDCQARHPKRCKHEENCNFFGKEFVHISSEQLKTLENKYKILKEEKTI